MRLVENENRAARAPERLAPRAGQIIGERYRLEAILERGAMGSVWRAEQISLRAPVAIKFLEPALIEDPEMNQRFMQEARSAAAIRSTHVVQVLDYGSDGNVPFIAMEYLDGENLETRLSRKGKLTPAELHKIFSEVARGIGQAHALGVIHRDVKPGNIFLAREGKHEVTKLVDFGIAKVMVDALAMSRNMGTRLGTVLGTPQYMSPEQLRGSSALDHRTDLWALAIIACECLTGHFPFAGRTLGDLTVQVCTEKPRAPSSLGHVPAGFDRWFFKGTRRSPVERFASVEEMAAALGTILLSVGGGPPAATWLARLNVAKQRVSGRAALLSTFAAVLHTRTLAFVSEPLRRTRPFLSPGRLLASALVLCGLGLLLLIRSGSDGAASGAQGPERRVEATQAVPPLPPPQPIPAAAVVAKVGADSMAGDGGVPLIEAVTSTAAVSVPARVPPRPAKLGSTPGPTPLGRMSIAMGRAGASILEGEGMRREARARAAEAERRSSERAPARPVSAPIPKSALESRRRGAAGQGRPL